MNVLKGGMGKILFKSFIQTVMQIQYAWLHTSLIHR